MTIYPSVHQTVIDTYPCPCAKGITLNLAEVPVPRSSAQDGGGVGGGSLQEEAGVPLREAWRGVRKASLWRGLKCD